MQNDSSEPKFSVEPAAIAAVLAHLRRSGVQFLPRSSADDVRLWSEKLALKGSPSVSMQDSELQAPSSLNIGMRASIAKAVAGHAARPTPNQIPSPEPYASVSGRSRLLRDESDIAISSTLSSYDGPSPSIDERITSLLTIRNEVAACTRCEKLACQRRLTVPGEGNHSARVCFLGEAPGADEDASGQPFVGRAGQLLTKMIEACTLRREDVFILNTIKCRPPGNRTPEHDEIENCRPFLDRQLEIIRPEYIVCLGLTAAQTILQSKLSVGRLRGKLHVYRGSKVLVTYHPSYLLREPEVKKAAWADLQFLLKDMGIELPKK